MDILLQQQDRKKSPPRRLYGHTESSVFCVKGGNHAGLREKMRVRDGSQCVGTGSAADTYSSSGMPTAYIV